jgi:hypothetical protein
MGIHDKIWADTPFRKRKVLLLYNSSTYSFLTMPAAKLVPHLPQQGH